MDRATGQIGVARARELGYSANVVLIFGPVAAYVAVSGQGDLSLLFEEEEERMTTMGVLVWFAAHMIGFFIGLKMVS